MKQAIAIFVLTAFLINSCKKDPAIPSPAVQTTETSHDYGKLAIGNYWIYQRFKIDNLGVVTPLNIYDSCYISRDTLINGNTYFEMYRPNTYGTFYSYLRDSSTYIVNHLGRIVFSYTDFSTVFRTGFSTASSTDTIAKAVFKMNNQDSLVFTPAGNFITSNSQVIYYMYPMWTHYYNIRYTNKCYAENIGIVIETLDLLMDKPFCEERRIVRYHVN